ncbi:unnamed protein product [Moneuplotes crassus]|uniref:Uncharacterized protein n=1 Tax=Euplotes crassus TaxID=5936 RepID=A0AAD1XDK6_EUPCR|nr:unnamed protein product [Moneuplotes crassus]
MKVVAENALRPLSVSASSFCCCKPCVFSSFLSIRISSFPCVGDPSFWRKPVEVLISMSDTVLIISACPSLYKEQCC